jgi:hypothetical protein
LVDEDELALCTPVALELLHSARDQADFDWIALGLEGFRTLTLDRRLSRLLEAHRRHSSPEASIAARSRPIS